MPRTPNAAAETRRRNNTSSGSDADLEPIKPPAPTKGWCKEVKGLWKAMSESAQAMYYEPSDWAFARVVLESLDRDLRPDLIGHDSNNEEVYSYQPIKGSNLSAYLKALDSLLLTEAARRKVRIEMSASSRGRSSKEAPPADEVAAKRTARLA